MKQLEHKDHIVSEKKYPITVVLDKVYDNLNIGSIFRLSDALGIEELYIVGNNELNFKQINKTSRNTHKTTKYSIFNNIEYVLKQLKENGYIIVSAEITDQSKDIRFINQLIERKSKIAIVFGNEENGVSQEALNLSDFSVHINMLGTNSSMNVAMSMGIICYELTKLY